MAVCNDFIHCECASIVEEMEWEQDELMKVRDELLKALEWYAEQAEDLNKGGWTAGKALGQLRADRGKRAKEAIAKAKGSQSYPQKRMKVRHS